MKWPVLNSSYVRLIRQIATGEMDSLLRSILFGPTENLQTHATSATKKNLFQKIKSNLRKYRSNALTMCGPAAIDTMIHLCQRVLDEGIPGDFLEAGVWRGGMPLLMRAYLFEKGVTDRKVWLADSFCGLPTNRNQMQDWRDRLASRLLGQVDQLAVSEIQVQNVFRHFGLLDSQVIFLKGWFKESLPTISSDQKFSLLRLDGDYYESTRDSLKFLHPKLSSGGFIIIDDYNLPFGCKRAVDEYREAHGIESPLISINQQSVYWRKDES